jgi:predicted peptidase
MFGQSVGEKDFSTWQKHNFRAASGMVLPYRILYPDSFSPSKKYPLVLFLHGAGERGSDNEKQLTHGAALFLQPEVRRNFPAIVVFPQCPQEGYWAQVAVDRTAQPYRLLFNYAQPPQPSLAAALELVRQLRRSGAVDKRRVYVAGLSMGGMGTFEAVHRQPRLFAAASPICGGGDAERLRKKQRRVPFWIFHGAADPVVGVQQSHDMVDALKALKADVQYTEYPGVGHDSWTQVFADPRWLAWMFAQKRKK